jgi:hypothetical protein
MWLRRSRVVALFDYVLTNGLIGTVDSNLTGSDGPWANVTTIGLRNLQAS